MGSAIFCRYSVYLVSLNFLAFENRCANVVIVFHDCTVLQIFIYDFSDHGNGFNFNFGPFRQCSSLQKEKATYIHVLKSVMSKGQLISKAKFQAIDSPKKQTNEFAFFDLKSCYVVKSNALSSFFWRNYNLKICFRN